VTQILCFIFFNFSATYNEKKQVTLMVVLLLLDEVSIFTNVKKSLLS